MTPQFLDQPAHTVVGLTIRTTAPSDTIKDLWTEFTTRFSEITNLAHPSICFGVSRNFDPQTEAFDYTVCVNVTNTDTLPDGMTALELPAGPHAVFETTLTTIADTYSHILEVWLPTSDRKHTGGPIYERYDETFDHTDPASTFQICVPVQPEF